MQVTNDGVLSLGEDFYSSNPEPFPLSNHVLIAPFWDDSENYGLNKGDVLYRFTTDKSVLDEITTNISSAFGVDFTPVTAFIATWDGVKDNDDNYYYNYYNDDDELVSERP